MIYSRELTQKYVVDVFVAGGGPAGIAAAVTAARLGKKVFIAEKNGCFGGSGTTGLVPSFCTFTDDREFLAGGFGREIHDALFGKDKALKYGFFTFDVERLKTLYDDIAVKSGIEFSFFTNIVDVVAKDGRIQYVVIAAKSGMYAVKAKIYIDCTGDGDVCEWAGGTTEFGDENGVAMPSTLCSMWSCIDYSKVDMPQSSRLEEAYNDGVFTNCDLHLPGIMRSDVEHGMGGGNIGHCYATDARSEDSLTKAMLWGRKYVREYEKYYKEYLHGYENIHLCYTADVLGIRESRRVIGDYVLCKKDFIERAVFDDEIGRYSYPVDIHAMSPDKEALKVFETDYKNLRYGPGESYGIPYRTLTPKGLTNVLVAGRCVSTDRSMQASIRVMPGCYITGQAAGVAATLACEGEDVRSVKVTELQKIIVDIGGYVPNRA